MADNNVPHAAMATLTRNDLHLQANYQIEAMCIALRSAAKSQDTEVLPYLVQSLALRISELNDASAISLASDEDDIENFRQVVFGM